MAKSKPKPKAKVKAAKVPAIEVVVPVSQLAEILRQLAAQANEAEALRLAGIEEARELAEALKEIHDQLEKAVRVKISVPEGFTLTKVGAPCDSKGAKST